MLKFYLYKCILALSLSVFSITSTLSNETTATKRPIEDTLVKSENEAEKPAEALPKKKQRAEKREDEEEREPTEEEIESKPSDPIPLEGSITKAADIGTWVGDKENGIANFQLSYQGTLISEEIKKWHLEMGAQIKKIMAKLDPQVDTTNYLRSRIDIIYKKEQLYEIRGASIPILFISGYTNKSAQLDVLDLQERIASITTDPCIPIDSYFEWRHLWKENYEPIRDKLKPLFTRIPEHDLISSQLINAEKDSLTQSSSHAFQFWLHSEEPLILYMLGEAATKADDNLLSPTFSEIIQGIKLPGNVVPEVCILSVVSRNDCCGNCRTLLLEAIEHKKFFHDPVLEGLKFEKSTALTKVILYSGLDEFKIKRPHESYLDAISLQKDDKIHFLMAANKANL
ncbi:hypothetical protein [Candidatus Odyssella thessalonicensis]|uniref:hypothetical protein n=1 Tax=Candidatus Odyssella thessalonicensis TaxID=84647 RepID=UPI000C1BF8A1|nr:hypothetical protein [Candidatus Odyssella thessalonicensis]